MISVFYMETRLINSVRCGEREIGRREKPERLAAVERAVEAAVSMVLRVRRQRILAEEVGPNSYVVQWESSEAGYSKVSSDVEHKGHVGGVDGLRWEKGRFSDLLPRGKSDSYLGKSSTTVQQHSVTYLVSTRILHSPSRRVNNKPDHRAVNGHRQPSRRFRLAEIDSPLLLGRQRSFENTERLETLLLPIINSRIRKVLELERVALREEREGVVRDIAIPRGDK